MISHFASNPARSSYASAGALVVVLMSPMGMPMRHARILAEDERLDGYRHRARRHADAAEVDVVEVAQRNAVEHQHFRAQREVFLQDAADGLRHVAFQDQEDGLALLDRPAQRGAD